MRPSRSTSGSTGAPSGSSSTSSQPRSRIATEQPKRPRPPRSGSRSVLLLLYGSRACRSADPSLRVWFDSVLCDLLCGWGKPNHAVVLHDGMYWLCTRKVGCVRVRADRPPAVKPDVVYRIEVTNPDEGPWRRGEKFTRFASILMSIGLLPPGMRCMNCVTATAGLIGIHARLRNASDLIRQIERLTCPSKRRSSSRASSQPAAL